jgi:hypothetical protein
MLLEYNDLFSLNTLLKLTFSRQHFEKSAFFYYNVRSSFYPIRHVKLLTWQLLSDQRSEITHLVALCNQRPATVHLVALTQWEVWSLVALSNQIPYLFSPGVVFIQSEVRTHLFSPGRRQCTALRKFLTTAYLPSIYVSILGDIFKFTRKQRTNKRQTIIYEADQSEDDKNKKC